jgi:nitrite reductase/ring-hydroxylating ferredoxin subunit
MHKLCSLDEIPDGDAIARPLPESGEVVLVRQGREVQAYRNDCPHLGIELNYLPDVFLDTEKRYIQCVNHDALFQIEDGFCVFGPCQGQYLERVPIEIREGEIWLSPSP